MIYEITGNISGQSAINSIISQEFIIILSPNSGFPGDTISIFTVSEFDSVKNNNVIYFGDVVATQYTLVSPNQIDVVIPNGIISADIRVKTPGKISNTAFFIVIYEDIGFTIPVKKQGTFSPGIVKSPTYNKDLAISNFCEVTDGTSMIQNVYNIILTRPGERLFNPGFGCEIHNKIFELMESRDTIEGEVLKMIEDSVNTFEPRVKVLTDLSRVEINEAKNSIDVNLRISIPNSNDTEIKLTIGTKRKD